VPEVVLAHELGIHYAALAYSINWATGIEKKTVIVGGNLPAVRSKMVALLVRVMQEPLVFECGCESARL
jgi:purine nucleoside phosphorylase